MLYEEVHDYEVYKHPGVQGEFLERLNEVLPSGSRPMVVADAGFAGAWYGQVETLGWDWIARVRGQVNYRLSEGASWSGISGLLARASRKVEELGWCWLSKSSRYRCRLVLNARMRKGRRDRANTRAHGHGTMEKKHRKAAKEPWLSATSLKAEEASAVQVIGMYEQRMQIEGRFRDVKSPRYGFWFRYSGTRSCQRIEVLLLIAALASWLLSLLGAAAKRKGWAAHFQANSERRREVLSDVFLGRRVYRNKRYRITAEELREAIGYCRELVAVNALPV